MRTGVATFGLDTGRCPPWLFERMKRLAGIVAEAIVREFGAEEFLKRMSDPVWFQSFGCVLAFDWNASGLTVTTLGALKEALRFRDDLGVFVCGGKGKTSRKTPSDILQIAERIGLDDRTGGRLVSLSKLVAKVDNNLIQDGFQLYHHSFLFTSSGDWSVVQQGMRKDMGKARRYHWRDALAVKERDLVDDPHRGIVSSLVLPRVLNLATVKSERNRNASVYLVENTKTFLGALETIQERSAPASGTRLRHLTLFENDSASDFRNHPVLFETFDAKRIAKTVSVAADFKPKTFLNLVALPGVGPKTIRALSLVGEIIYGAKPSYEDPARYSFAHGGKDAIPFPVDVATYDRTIAVMERAISGAPMTYREKTGALERLEKEHKKLTLPNRRRAPML